MPQVDSLHSVDAGPTPFQSGGVGFRPIISLNCVRRASAVSCPARPTRKAGSLPAVPNAINHYGFSKGAGGITGWRLDAPSARRQPFFNSLGDDACTRDTICMNLPVIKCRFRASSREPRPFAIMTTAPKPRQRRRAAITQADSLRTIRAAQAAGWSHVEIEQPCGTIVRIKPGHRLLSQASIF